ncbi:2',3'-cyclic nucleotide 3'-phosphodiesterase [Schaereria dolodes]|nr:2',3'-cyclic nucleotide 3'-phosphodiesterase [Schaereria dolodes]
MPLSLWLTPPPTSLIYSQLSSLIEYLRTVHPSLITSPIFKPHVTLAFQIPSDNKDLSVLSIPKDLSSSIKCLMFGNTYTKKIYFSMKSSPGLEESAHEARMKLNGLGEEDAKRAMQSDFDPHTSLVYNEVELNDEIRSVVHDAVLKRAQDFGYRDWEGLSWKGGQLILVKTEGPVEEWEVLATTDVGS